MTNLSEETRDLLEGAYHGLYMEFSKNPAIRPTLEKLEQAMVNMGLLEADPEEEEADGYDTETNWDEWFIDYKIDLEREERAEMEGWRA